MAKQRINIGEAVNDKRGDPLRTAFDKVNQNFDELYALTGGASAALTELAQDYAALLFTHANHTNITATYDDANNKILLTGTAAQIQSDWTQENNAALDFIKNKPTIPAEATWPVTNTNGTGGPAKIAIGRSAGDINQGTATVAIGSFAGNDTQGGAAIAIGTYAGQTTQGNDAVVVGYRAAETSQGTGAVSIGRQAGQTNQGAYSIAIGKLAGQTNQAANTIILNAVNAPLNGVAAQTNSFYVSPIRIDATPSNVLFYNTTTKEVTYGSAPSATVSSLVNGSETVSLGTDGATRLPGGAGFAKGESGQLKTDDGVTLSLDFRDTSGRGFYTNSDGFSLRGNGSYTWKFGVDGTLNLPESAESNVAVIQSTESIKVIANGKTWSFANDGDLTIPPNGDILNSTGSSVLVGTGNIEFRNDSMNDINGILITNASQTVAATANITIPTNGADAPLSINNDGKTWSFDTDGTLTLPQYGRIKGAGSNASIDLNTVGTNESNLSLTTYVDGEMLTSAIDITPAIGIALNSVRRVDIVAGWDNATAKYDAWLDAEALWVEVRNQDAQLIAPDTRPWDGMPSYEAYTVLLNYNHVGPGIPPSSNMAPIANTAKSAYLIWQEEQAAINVTITARDNTWTFGNDGQLIVPGAIRKNGGLYMNSGGNGISSTVFVNGTAGSVILRTDNGTTLKSLTFDVNGVLTLPNGATVAASSGNSLATEITGNQYGWVGLFNHNRANNVYVEDFRVTITADNKPWKFENNGEFIFPNNALQQDSENTICAANADTSIYADTNGLNHTIKLIVQVEGLVGNESTTDTQSCEILVARSINGNRVSATTYAVVHTSASPLATFAASWNSGIGRVVVTCRPTSLSNSVTVRTFATEIKRA